MTEQEDLKKKLESMSPEELLAFQKEQCIFCKMAEGKVSSRKIYEDQICVAVLDINPANPGHLLLFPKQHRMILPQLTDEELAHMFVIAKRLSQRLLKNLQLRGTNLFVANGPAAGQRAQHFMMHLIPRKEGDGLSLTLEPGKRTASELKMVAEKMRPRLLQLLGKAPETSSTDKEEAEKSPKPMESSPHQKKQQLKEPPVSKNVPEEDDEGVSLDDIARVLNG